MDPFEQIPEAPDLSGQVAIQDLRPAFIGPYSCIYRGKLIQDGQQVAVKVINAVRGSALHTMQRKLSRERRTWGALDHPNILPLYGFADDESFQPFGALISPWMQQGDAADFLAEHDESLVLEQRIGLWQDVIAGVHYLHSYNPQLIHGDLKPKNILIDDSGHARICDFGLVRVFLEGGSTGWTTTTGHTGTERYLSHELVVAAEEARPTMASDIWAVGCIGLQFIFSQIPYSSRKGNFGGAIFIDIKNGVPPAECSSELPPTLHSIWACLESCWELDPNDRPDAATLSAWLAEELVTSILQPLDGPSVPENRGGSEDVAESLVEGHRTVTSTASIENPTVNVSATGDSGPFFGEFAATSHPAPGTTLGAQVPDTNQYLAVATPHHFQKPNRQVVRFEDHPRLTAKDEITGYVFVDPNPGPLIPPLVIPSRPRTDNYLQLATTGAKESERFQENDVFPLPPSPSWSEAATYGGDLFFQNPPSPSWSDAATSGYDYFIRTPPESPRFIRMNKEPAKVWGMTKKESSSTLAHDQYRSSSNSRDTTSKLASVRAKMQQEDVDYLIIPFQDGHLSENTVEAHQRLRWISNFSGRSGTAIVSKNSAYLFVESRYWLQAGRELDSNWTIHRIGTEGIDDWLSWAVGCRRGNKIAIDARSVSHERATELYKGLHNRGSKLAHPQQNLVDLAWKDRPKRPADPICLYPKEYTGEDIGDKLDKIRRWIRRQNAAEAATYEEAEENSTAVFISDLNSIAYALSLRGTDLPFSKGFMAYLVVQTNNTATLFLDTNKASEIKSDLLEEGVTLREYSDVWSYLRGKNWGRGKIIIDPNTPYAVSRIIGSECYILRSSYIEEIKAVKNKVEIEGLRTACIRDGASMIRWLAWLEHKFGQGYDITEWEALEKLGSLKEDERIGAGRIQMYLGPAYENMVATEANATLPFYIPTKNGSSAITKKTLFIVDSGSMYMGGDCNTARTLHFGSPTTEQIESFTRVLQAHISIDVATFPAGTPGKHFAALAGKALRRDDRDSLQEPRGYFNVQQSSHSFNLSKPLLPGHVVINEPGFYKSGEFGIRIGSTLLVRQVQASENTEPGVLYGFERLTQVPIQTKMVRSSMLTKEEQQWVKDHNSNVLRTLEPHLVNDKRALKWLRHECQNGILGKIKGFAKLGID